MAKDEQSGDPEKRREELMQQCSQLARDDPPRALALARRYGLDMGPGAVVEGIVQTWAQKNVHAACAWTMAQPAGVVKNECSKRIAFVWAQTHPEEAAQFVIEKIPPGDAQIESAMTVIHQWALSDMGAVSAWVKLFPDGELRNRAIRELQAIPSYHH